jgi:transaldolase
MADSPFLRMSRETPTVLWNDSADPVELTAAMGWGAVGATCNPVLALAALQADFPSWRRRILEIGDQYPLADDSWIGWRLIRELSVHAAEVLHPVFLEHAGRNGRLSIQTDPRLHRDASAIADQACEFSELAPNIIVKIPVTAPGVAAIEEATFRGVSINATVSFTLPQALAVGAAVERGLRRREVAELPVDSRGPVCTIMVGRLDDWLRVVAERDGVDIDPTIFNWAGVATFKKAYRIYEDRGYRTRLLSAAFRCPLHWSELVGGDVVISPPYDWQVRLNASGIEPVSRIHEPVDESIVSTLYNNFAEFRKAYDEDGMSEAEFSDFGATRRTLRQFLAATADLETLVRGVTIPDPDSR